MTAPKKPIRLSDIFAEPEQVELSNGRVTPVRLIDAIGYDLYLQMLKDPEENPLRLWDIVERCLPGVPREEIRTLNIPESTAIIAIAVGRVDMVQQLFAEAEGKGQALKVAEPTSEPQRSSTPPDSSVSESPAS